MWVRAVTGMAERVRAAQETAETPVSGAVARTVDPDRAARHQSWLQRFGELSGLDGADDFTEATKLT